MDRGRKTGPDGFLQVATSLQLIEFQPGEERQYSSPGPQVFVVGGVVAKSPELLHELPAAIRPAGVGQYAHVPDIDDLLADPEEACFPSQAHL